MSNLHLLRINSFEEYNKLFAEEAKLFQMTQEFENSIIENEKNQLSFYFNGYCFVCNADSSFLVDYLYSSEINGVKIPNWRERLICSKCKLNNRMRAVIHILFEECNPSQESTIYLTEQITPLYKFIKNKFPNAIGSEYLGNEIAFGSIREDGIRNETLTSLSFKDGQIDSILCFDVLEHIPDYKQGFAECNRVLNDNGIMIFTVPFTKNSASNVIRATVDEKGEIIHHKEPQYHGVPVNNEGILCFQDFGWEMLDELREVGFKEATALIYWSDVFAYLGGGQIAFVAKKSKSIKHQKTIAPVMKKATNFLEKEGVNHTNYEFNPPVPLEGCAKQVSEAEGLFEDLWVGNRLKFAMKSESQIAEILVEGYIPEQFVEGNSFAVHVGRHTIESSYPGGQIFEWSIPVLEEANKVIEVELEVEKLWNPKKAGVSEDGRDLGVKLMKFVINPEKNSKQDKGGENLSRDAKSYFNLGNQFKKQGRLEEAVKSYKSAIELNSNFCWYHHNLGAVLVALGCSEEGIGCYRRAIELNPDSSWYHHNLAEALLKKGDLEKAIAYYHRSIELEPSFFQSHNKLGVCLRKQGKISEAIACHRRAIELNPKVANVFNNLGEALVAGGEVLEAIDCYRHAIELNPKLFRIHYNLGVALAEKGDFKEAIRAYNRALELNPSFSKADNDFKQALGKLDDVGIYYEVLNTISDRPEFYFELGKALAKKSRVDEAINCYLKAIQTKPDFAQPYQTLRNTNLNSSQLEEAIATYRSAIELKPNLLPAYINLARALTKNGKSEEAINYYHEAIYRQTLAFKPNFVKEYWHPEAPRKPYFLIIGAGKCGTSSLYLYMSQHPQVLTPVEKEIHFFTQEFHQGIDWYLAHFPPIPETANFITGEASTSYIGCHNDAEKKVFDLFPDVKLLVALRNPADRSISDYHQAVRLGKEERSLEEAFMDELEILKEVDRPFSVSQTYWQKQKGYLWDSLYFYFIEKWMSLFRQQQFLILSSEEFYQKPQATMQQVFEFLGLPDYQLAQYPKYNSGDYQPVNDSIRQKLSNFFEPHNLRLEEFLGKRFNWK